MDEPIRHREFTRWDIEDMRRMTPAQKLDLALELSLMVIKLNEAGRRSRSL